MKLIDNLKSSLRQWLLLDEEIHSIDRTNMNDMTIYDEYALYDAWAISDSNILSNTYKNLPGSYNTTFWKAKPENKMVKRTTGLASITLSALQNIISDNYDHIEFGEGKETLKELWNEIEKDNNFEKVRAKSVRDALVFGEGAFKITYINDISKYPIVTFVPAKKCNIKYLYGRVVEIEFFDNTYTMKDKVYTLHEIYKRGSIEYKLLNEDGKEVLLSTVPECSELEDIIFTDNKFMAAIPFKIFESDKYEYHGESIFANGKTDILDQLDETFTSYGQTIRVGSPKTFYNDDMIEYDENGHPLTNSTTFNPFFIKHAGSTESSDQIQVIQNALNSAEYGEAIAQHITLFCSGLISPATLAIQLQNTALINNDSGEAQREKEKQTLYTVNKIKNALCECLPEVIATTLQFSAMLVNSSCDIEKDDISIIFDDYANPSEEAITESLQKAMPNMVLKTFEDVVSEQFGSTISEEEREERIRQLYIINYGVENIDELLEQKRTNITSFKENVEQKDEESEA